MSRAPRPHRRRLARWLPRRLRRTAGLALLALTPGLGCGREFFRQWADQDVTEAVFEKSRDPRWQLKTFSIDPPAMSRYADPYDIDRPAAPPDDYATEALSPYPQKPHIRLLTPVEGTGYLEMLAAGPRYDAPPSIEEQLEAGAVPPVPTPAAGVVPPGAVPGAGVPPTSPAPGPFAPGSVPTSTEPGNSGTEPGELTPNSNIPALPSPVPGTPPSVPNRSPQTQTQKRDPGVLTAAYQAPATPATPPGARPTSPG